MNINRIVRLRPWLVIFAIMAITGAVACGGGIGGDTEVRESSFRFGDAPTIQVEASNGYITVVSGPDGAINVKAIIRDPDNVEYEIVQTGDTISITASEKRSGIFSFGHSSGTNIEVTVPSNTLLELKSSNGRVEERWFRKTEQRDKWNRCLSEA